jgi:hypothetical protein
LIRTWHNVPVPFITSWSEELEAAEKDAELLTIRTRLTLVGRTTIVREFLGYRDERPGDRDSHGLLWHRVPDEPGVGRPLFKSVHPVRQRTCMQTGSCQICAGPASVWMTPTDRWTDHVVNRGADAPFSTADPPVCFRCARLAMRHCPKLAGEGWVLLTAAQWAPTAVQGLKADGATARISEAVSTLTLPVVAPPPDPAALPLFLAMVLMATLWRPTVLADPADSPGLGLNLAARGRPAGM